MTYMIALSCLNRPARVTVKEDSTIVELENARCRQTTGKLVDTVN
jgi:hypothetical protein